MINAEQQKVHTCLLENGFVPVDTESHATLKDFNGANRLYEMTACLTVIWADELSTLYKIIDGFLCIANFYSDGKFSFSVDRPAAPHDLKHIVDILYCLSLKAGLETLPIWLIEERFLDDYRRLSGYRMKAEYSDAMSEYVYSTESLLDLDGKVNRNKRRQLEKFLDKPNVSVQTITRENVKVCLDIENEWCALQDCDLCRSFAGCSKKTAETMVDIFDGSVYQGVLGYVDGTPAGYSIFEKASEELAYGHVAKTAMPNFSVYLYYTAVQHHLGNVKYINLGADLGIEGLRLFKQRLGAYELWKKYLCTFTKEG